MNKKMFPMHHEMFTGANSVIRLEPAGGSSKLVPQRPVCLLNGQVELQSNQVVQVM